MSDAKKYATVCDEQCIHHNLIDVVNSKMPDEDDLYDLAELFKIFGDST